MKDKTVVLWLTENRRVFKIKGDLDIVHKAHRRPLISACVDLLIYIVLLWLNDVWMIKDTLLRNTPVA